MHITIIMYKAQQISWNQEVTKKLRFVIFDPKIIKNLVHSYCLSTMAYNEELAECKQWFLPSFKKQANVYLIHNIYYVLINSCIYVHVQLRWCHNLSDNLFAWKYTTYS